MVTYHHDFSSAPISTLSEESGTFKAVVPSTTGQERQTSIGVSHHVGSDHVLRVPYLHLTHRVRSMVTVQATEYTRARFHTKVADGCSQKVNYLGNDQRMIAMATSREATVDSSLKNRRFKVVAQSRRHAQSLQYRKMRRGRRSGRTPDFFSRNKWSIGSTPKQ